MFAAIRPASFFSLFQRPAKRPDERAKANYFAAWYQIGQQDLPAAA
jgi:hypothetical protein